MAILRAKEIRELNLKKLQEKEEELKKELLKLKMQVAGGTPPENPGRIRLLRRTLARIKTISRARSDELKEQSNIKQKSLALKTKQEGGKK